MKVTLTKEEVEYALLVHLFSKTGMKIQPNDERLWFTYAKCEVDGLCQSFDVQKVEIHIKD